MITTPIHVTKTFLPPPEEYKAYIDRIWQSGFITNKGPLLVEFEDKIKDYLKVENFQFVTNGTLALQLAIDGLGITKGEIITTPFSYVASTSAILWQRAKPVFVDINPDTLCIDETKIEQAITSKTKAILAVHVFGNPCEVEKIELIAKKHNISVIYDGAHAFGVIYKGRSIFDYGDISTASFHATKLFHTIEGGGIFTRNEKLNEQVDLKKRFGHHGDTHITLGINAKASDFQAAMGLCNLKYVDELVEERKQISKIYDSLIGRKPVRPQLNEGTDSYNYAYYPIILGNENELKKVISILNAHNIYPRRYFYPSLNTLPYVDETASCPVSEDVASRMVCLPLYPGLEQKIVNKISQLITSVLDEK